MLAAQVTPYHAAPLMPTSYVQGIFRSHWERWMMGKETFKDFTNVLKKKLSFHSAFVFVFKYPHLSFQRLGTWSTCIYFPSVWCKPWIFIFIIWLIASYHNISKNLFSPVICYSIFIKHLISIHMEFPFSTGLSMYGSAL